MRRRATVIAALGALSLAACGGDGDNGASSHDPGGAIDTRAGTYRGVGIGDDVATMQREFGPQAPAEEGECVVARSVEGENDYSWVVIQLTPPHTASPAQERAYRYEHVVFLARKGRIGAVIVTQAAQGSTEGLSGSAASSRQRKRSTGAAVRNGVRGQRVRGVLRLHGQDRRPAPRLVRRRPDPERDGGDHPGRWTMTL